MAAQGDIPSFDIDGPIWCDSCRRLKEEVQRLQEEHSLNYRTLKQKIISTDLLIRKYQTKCEEHDSQNKRLEEITRKFERAQRDSETLTHQLSLSLEDTEPIKKANADLESLVVKKNAEIQRVQDRLEASESLCRQYEAFKKNSLDFDSQTKLASKRVQQLELSNKKLEQSVSALKNEVRTCKFENTKSNNVIKSLQTKLQKTLGRLERYWEILKENALIPKGDKRPSQANIVNVDTPETGFFSRSSKRTSRVDVIDFEDDSMQEALIPKGDKRPSQANIVNVDTPETGFFSRSSKRTSRVDVIDIEDDSMQEVPFQRIERKSSLSTITDPLPAKQTQEQDKPVHTEIKKPAVEEVLDETSEDDDDDFDAVSTSSDLSFKFTMSPVLPMLSPLPTTPLDLQKDEESCDDSSSDDEMEIINAFKHHHNDETPELDFCDQTSDNHQTCVSPPIKSLVKQKTANQTFVSPPIKSLVKQKTANQTFVSPPIKSLVKQKTANQKVTKAESSNLKMHQYMEHVNTFSSANEDDEVLTQKISSSDTDQVNSTHPNTGNEILSQDISSDFVCEKDNSRTYVENGVKSTQEISDSEVNSTQPNNGNEILSQDFSSDSVCGSKEDASIRGVEDRVKSAQDISSDSVCGSKENASTHDMENGVKSTPADCEDKDLDVNNESLVLDKRQQSGVETSEMDKHGIKQNNTATLNTNPHTHRDISLATLNTNPHTQRDVSLATLNSNPHTQRDVSLATLNSNPHTQRDVSLATLNSNPHTQRDVSLATLNSNPHTQRDASLATLNSNPHTQRDVSLATLNSNPHTHRDVSLGNKEFVLKECLASENIGSVENLKNPVNEKNTSLEMDEVNPSAERMTGNKSKTDDDAVGLEDLNDSTVSTTENKNSEKETRPCATPTCVKEIIEKKADLKKKTSNLLSDEVEVGSGTERDCDGVDKKVESISYVEHKKQTIDQSDICKRNEYSADSNVKVSNTNKESKNLKHSVDLENKSTTVETEVNCMLSVCKSDSQSSVNTERSSVNTEENEGKSDSRSSVNTERSSVNTEESEGKSDSRPSVNTEKNEGKSNSRSSVNTEESEGKYDSRSFVNTEQLEDGSDEEVVSPRIRKSVLLISDTDSYSEPETISKINNSSQRSEGKTRKSGQFKRKMSLPFNVDHLRKDQIKLESCRLSEDSIDSEDDLPLAKIVNKLRTSPGIKHLNENSTRAKLFLKSNDSGVQTKAVIVEKTLSDKENTVQSCFDNSLNRRDGKASDTESVSSRKESLGFVQSFTPLKSDSPGVMRDSSGCKTARKTFTVRTQSRVVSKEFCETSSDSDDDVAVDTKHNANRLSSSKLDSEHSDVINKVEAEHSSKLEHEAGHSNAINRVEAEPKHSSKLEHEVVHSDAINRVEGHGVDLSEDETECSQDVAKPSRRITRSSSQPNLPNQSLTVRKYLRSKSTRETSRKNSPSKKIFTENKKKSSNVLPTPLSGTSSCGKRNKINVADNRLLSGDSFVSPMKSHNRAVKVTDKENGNIESNSNDSQAQELCSTPRKNIERHIELWNSGRKAGKSKRRRDSNFSEDSDGENNVKGISVIQQKRDKKSRSQVFSTNSSMSPAEDDNFKSCANLSGSSDNETETKQGTRLRSQAVNAHGDNETKTKQGTRSMSQAVNAHGDNETKTKQRTRSMSQAVNTHGDNETKTKQRTRSMSQPVNAHGDDKHIICDTHFSGERDKETIIKDMSVICTKRRTRSLSQVHTSYSASLDDVKSNSHNTCLSDDDHSNTSHPQRSTRSRSQVVNVGSSSSVEEVDKESRSVLNEVITECDTDNLKNTGANRLETNTTKTSPDDMLISENVDKNTNNSNKQMDCVREINKENDVAEERFVTCDDEEIIMAEEMSTSCNTEADVKSIAASKTEITIQSIETSVLNLKGHTDLNSEPDSNILSLPTLCPSAFRPVHRGDSRSDHPINKVILDGEDGTVCVNKNLTSMHQEATAKLLHESSSHGDKTVENVDSCQISLHLEAVKPGKTKAGPSENVSKIVSRSISCDNVGNKISSKRKSSQRKGRSQSSESAGNKAQAIQMSFDSSFVCSDVEFSTGSVVNDNHKSEINSKSLADNFCDVNEKQTDGLEHLQTTKCSASKDSCKISEEQTVTHIEMKSRKSPLITDSGDLSEKQTGLMEHVEVESRKSDSGDLGLKQTGLMERIESKKSSSQNRSSIFVSSQNSIPKKIQIETQTSFGFSANPEDCDEENRRVVESNQDILEFIPELENEDANDCDDDRDSLEDNALPLSFMTGFKHSDRAGSPGILPLTRLTDSSDRKTPPGTEMCSDDSGYLSIVDLIQSELRTSAFSPVHADMFEIIHPVSPLPSSPVRNLDMFEIIQPVSPLPSSPVLNIDPSVLTNNPFSFQVEQSLITETVCQKKRKKNKKSKLVQKLNIKPDVLKRKVTSPEDLSPLTCGMKRTRVAHQPRPGAPVHKLPKFATEAPPGAITVKPIAAVLDSRGGTHRQASGVDVDEMGTPVGEVNSQLIGRREMGTSVGEVNSQLLGRREMGSSVGEVHSQLLGRREMGTSVGEVHSQLLGRHEMGTSVGEVNSQLLGRREMGPSVGEVNSQLLGRREMGPSVGEVNSQLLGRREMGTSVGEVNSQLLGRLEMGTSVGEVHSQLLGRREMGTSVGEVNSQLLGRLGQDKDSSSKLPGHRLRKGSVTEKSEMKGLKRKRDSETSLTIKKTGKATIPSTGEKIEPNKTGFELQLDKYLNDDKLSTDVFVAELSQTQSVEEAWTCLVAAVVKHLQNCTVNTHAEVHAACAASDTHTRLPLCRTDEQRLLRIITHFLNIHQSASKHLLMEGLWEAVFVQEKEANKLYGKQALCRMFVSLCQAEGDLEQARVFLFYIISSKHLSFPCICLSAVGVWPLTLMKTQKDANPVVMVMESIIMKSLQGDSTRTKSKQIVECFVKLCGWSKVQRASEDVLKQMVDKLYDAATLNKTEKTFELIKSIQLLLVYEGWPWLQTNFIQKHFMSLRDRWFNRAEAGLSPLYVQSMLKIVGGIFELNVKPDNKDINKLIDRWLATFLNRETAVAAVPLCSADVVLIVSPFAPVKAINLLFWWCKKHKDILTDDFKEKLTKTTQLLSARVPMFTANTSKKTKRF